MRIITLLALCALLYCSRGHQQEDCLKQHIQLPVIREMLNVSLHIPKFLPRDNKKSKQILGKLTVCKKPIKEIAFLYNLLKIYEEHVFQKLWKNTSRQRPVSFMDDFSRLKNDMELCVNGGPSNLPLCAKNNFRKMEAKFKMLQREDLIKAVSEFYKVLTRIIFIIDRERTPKKN